MRDQWVFLTLIRYVLTEGFDQLGTRLLVQSITQLILEIGYVTEKEYIESVLSKNVKLEYFDKVQELIKKVSIKRTQL
jgi:hypothetical protein